MLRALMAASVALTLAVAPAQAAEEINFGVISTEASSNLKKIWEPFLAEMEKGTGLKINAFFASDYAGVIEGMRFNKVQLAWFGNKSAMEAVDRADGEVFAQTVAANGDAGYWSHIIVHKDSPYQSLDDILKCDKSLDFGIGDPNSTSGFLVPTTFIFSAKSIDPKTCFRTVRNANHQANAMAVANKQVAAATTNSEDLQRVAAAAPDARSQIKIIWTSPLIPLDPLVWRKDLDPAVKTKLYTFLMSYGRIGSDEEIKGAKATLANLIWSPFQPSSDNQLLPIRILEANKSLMKVQGDEKLSQEEKSREIAAIRAEIAALEEREKKADGDDFQRRAAAFLEADKAGRQDELKKMIADLAAGNSGTH